MRPVILIIESRPEVAEALQEVVISASYSPVVRPHVDRLADLGVAVPRALLACDRSGAGFRDAPPRAAPHSGTPASRSVAQRRSKADIGSAALRPKLMA